MSKQFSTKSDALLENIMVTIDEYTESKNIESIEKIKKYLMEMC